MGDTPNFGHILSHQACQLRIRLTNAEYGLAQHIRRVERTLAGTEWHWAAFSAATTGFPSKATPTSTGSCTEVKRSEPDRHQD